MTWQSWRTINNEGGHPVSRAHPQYRCSQQLMVSHRASLTEQASRHRHSKGPSRLLINATPMALLHRRSERFGAAEV